MKNVNKEYFINIVEKSELETITTEILELKMNMVENSIVLGTKLKQVKESLKHGEWIPYLEEKVEVSVRTAQKFIKIATEFANTKSLSHLGTEKLYILLDLPKAEREEFIIANRTEKMSTRELTKKIKEINHAKKVDKKVAKEVEIIEVEIAESSIIYDAERIIETKNMNEPKITVDTEKILKKATDLIEEIKIRTGDFYTSIDWVDDVNCDDRGGVLAQLYAIGEITENELIETIKAHQIELDINFKNLNDGTAIENYLNYVSNTYNRYNIGTGKRYLSIINTEMSYENVVEYAWEENEEERLGYVKDSKQDTFIKDNITISNGYDDCIEMLCVYKDRETLAHFQIDADNNLEKIRKLFKFYKIDYSYLNLAEQFINKIKADKLEDQKIYFENIKSKAKFINQQIQKNSDVYTIILQDNPYGNDGDVLYIFKKVELLGSVTLEDVLGGDKFVFELKENKNLLKLLEKIEKRLWNKFKKIILFDNIRLFMKRKEEEEKERTWQENFRDNSEEYKSYNNENMFAATYIKEEDKLIYKKIYKTLAIAFHPDKTGGDGAEMKIINGLKVDWGI